MEGKVLTKKQNFRLWQGGKFGNKLLAWRTVADWRTSGFSGSVVLRVLLPAGGGPTRYNLHPDDVDGVVGEWVDGGIPLEAIMVNEAAPDKDVVLQGEYLNDVYGAGDDASWGFFRYSRVARHMHEALAERTEVARGLMADLMLKQAMTPSSHEDWLLLLDRYGGHALEVSIYSRCLGDTPWRNTLVWEVRRY